eukprot:TRINITY_DN5222_c1_g1_i9.p1 TRINITY_DN5222_c1_g1~~TRINITY_DN5222_c1_g1_i9.p1  ORF type:complete len:173 (-),score=33.27 TRINITY_DN5222_c1_g1_i9:2-520(-)
MPNAKANIFEITALTLDTIDQAERLARKPPQLERALFSYLWYQRVKQNNLDLNLDSIVHACGFAAIVPQEAFISHIEALPDFFPLVRAMIAAKKFYVVNCDFLVVQPVDYELRQIKLQKERAELAILQAKADQEIAKANQERIKADQERIKADQERIKAEILAKQLLLLAKQ